MLKELYRKNSLKNNCTTINLIQEPPIDLGGFFIVYFKKRSLNETDFIITLILKSKSSDVL